MEKWRRLAVVANVGLIALCAASIMAPYLYQAGGLAAARWRWARNGDDDYTVVAAQYCNCYITGAYRLTVRGGRVVHVTPADDPGRALPLVPKAFDHLTVEAAFTRAEQAIRNHWLPDWDRRLIVEYDPLLGYVTHFEIGDRRAAQFYFVYAAREVELKTP